MNDHDESRSRAVGEEGPPEVPGEVVTQRIGVDDFDDDDIERAMSLIKWDIGYRADLPSYHLKYYAFATLLNRDERFLRFVTENVLTALEYGLPEMLLYEPDDERGPDCDWWAEVLDRIPAIVQRASAALVLREGPSES